MLLFGKSIEPGDMALEDERWEAPCPRCTSPSEHGHIERLEGGSINIYRTVACTPCEYHAGFDFMSP